MENIFPDLFFWFSLTNVTDGYRFSTGAEINGQLAS